jgi:hypothetical protein
VTKDIPPLRDYQVADLAFMKRKQRSGLLPADHLSRPTVECLAGAGQRLNGGRVRSYCDHFAFADEPGQAGAVDTGKRSSAVSIEQILHTPA